MSIAEAQLLNKLLDTKAFDIISDFGIKDEDFSVCKDQYDFIIGLHLIY